MKTMKLGKTGIDISRMGLGTWSIGGGSAWGGDHDLQVGNQFFFGNGGILGHDKPRYD